MSSRWLTATLVLLVLSGCSEQASEQQLLQQTVRQAVAIEQSDGCHLCGMLISEFDGPKGELYDKTAETAKKFCSTRDLFGYLLQLENRRQVKQVFVHDMSKTPWHKPQDQYFIDAKHAWYVIDSNKNGAMGKTLASFSQQADAQAFATEFGGQLYRFDQITLALL